ncbi:hypothetical protein L2735_10455 [Shewanella olleyana]|uniref:hypothetical protein n=1 Tax=Shewanella olleyana TaxID=135626 RepID=UPI00200F3747|nr:hypothetical protein [Shewanella olleyana]MCL1067228.1 hypothetical protein [Shewanella olleyana]
MSLSKEWFDKRDKFIALQKKQGNYTVGEAIEWLNSSISCFYDLGVFTQAEFSIMAPGHTELTPVGRLFFVESFQQTFISPKNLYKLKEALNDWDNFSIQYELFESDLVGTIAVKNQKHVKFKTEGSLFNYKLSFNVENINSELNSIFFSKNSDNILNIWNDFSQCVSLIEAEDKSPTNAEIATDKDTMETLCLPWHPLVQRYFRNKMHLIGFEHNLAVLKNEIEATYSVDNSEWRSINASFVTARPSCQIESNETQVYATEEVEVKLINQKSINLFGIVEPNTVERVIRKRSYLKRSSWAQPGSVLLFKSADRKHVKVAYYPESYTQPILCSEVISIFQAKGLSLWDGKRLFLFLTSKAGQTLLEYTFRDFSINELTQMRLTQRQINLLEIPQIDSTAAQNLDNKYCQLQNLFKQKNYIESQIKALLQ